MTTLNRISHLCRVNGARGLAKETVLWLVTVGLGIVIVAIGALLRGVTL